VLRKIFKPNREDLTRNWRKVYNEELHELAPSLDILFIKSRRMTWAICGERGEECMQAFGGET
jgi:hypothetical protein